MAAKKAAKHPELLLIAELVVERGSYTLYCFTACGTNTN